ncbi:hypothetical protein N9X16_03410 [Planktomarina temperata]|nr:hypothetical protein [Planktomarina temperata]
MKRILLTTTSLVLAAGVAQAEVTFSGKAEAGVSRTEEVKASAPTTGTGWAYNASGVLTLTKTGTLVSAPGTTAAADALAVTAAEHAYHAAQSTALLGDVNVAKATQAKNAANRAYLAGTAAVAAGDMVAYSGYDMDVAVSSTLDNGMELSAAFDMGAGSIADRDDDRVLDAQGGAIALSAVTIKNGGVTYVIGNDEIDDLYDDTQNGDVSVSGAMGGISYTLVADLDKDTKAVAASTTHDATASAETFVVVDAVAAVHESTSLKLSGAAGGVTWSFTTTNKDDFGDAASKVTLGYAAGDALSFSLTHDTDGAAEAINTLSATYTMDAISLTVSGADDKNHARNTNTGSKASQNMTIAYANGPLTASFNNDESSAWWATTSYDLGNGADIFATVDHQEFAVVGLTFAF